MLHYIFISLPLFKHWFINGKYSSANPYRGDLSDMLAKQPPSSFTIHHNTIIKLHKDLQNPCSKDGKKDLS
jgi:hypothetical protein